MWSCIRIGSYACAKIVHVSPAIVAAYLAVHPLPTNCEQTKCHWVIPPSEWQPGGMFYPPANGVVYGPGYGGDRVGFGAGALGLGGGGLGGWSDNDLHRGIHKAKEVTRDKLEHDCNRGVVHSYDCSTDRPPMVDVAVLPPPSTLIRYSSPPLVAEVLPPVDTPVVVVPVSEPSGALVFLSAVLVLIGIRMHRR